MSNFAYKCLMETNKLTGSNFTDWLRCLRLVLRHDKVEYVLDKPIGVIPDKESLEFATFDVEAHQKHIDNASDAQCVMLSSMSLELQRQHEHMFPYEMLKHLESLYASQAQTMEYEILRDLFKCKLRDGSKVSEHVLKMIGLIERLASIGTVLPANVSTNLILQSLPSSFENFIVYFNMNNTKVKSVLMVSSSAKSSKWKNKQQQKKKASKDAVLKPKSGGPRRSRNYQRMSVFSVMRRNTGRKTAQNSRHKVHKVGAQIQLVAHTFVIMCKV
ncbi:uncharacterized protein LOC121808832 [Salvia splendens]|uniref:uncharacterized protein LOC121808832 n=1 Tax=Salvia splendens TaxID=180675 RepID=UPI001C27C72B|nr:uncharacterized protein LOC121808832 [Salvia splendens]